MAREKTPAAIAQAILDLIGLTWVNSTRVSVNPASTAAEATSTTAVALTGVLPGDYVLAAQETDDLLAINAGIHWSASDADEVSFNLSNNIVAAGAAIDLAAATWNITVLRRAA